MNRRHLFPLAASAALLPTRGRAQGTPQAESDAARVLTRLMNEVLIPHDLTALPELVADEFGAQDPSDINGREAWAQRLTTYWQTFRSLPHAETVEEVIGNDAVAAARTSWRLGSEDDPVYRGDALYLAHVAKGKITRLWVESGEYARTD